MGEIFNPSSSKQFRSKLRRNMPPAEVLLWTRLRGSQFLGLKFRRQHGVGKYILDFYCPELRLAIEIDGLSHAEEKSVAYDANRDDEIARLGIQIVRFRNQEIMLDLPNTLERLAEIAQKICGANQQI